MVGEEWEKSEDLMERRKKRLKGMLDGERKDRW